MTHPSTEQALQRQRYLDAMGITSYVSRTALAGAAPTQRLALMPRERLEPAAQAPIPSRQPLAQAEAGASPSPVSDLISQPASRLPRAEPPAAPATQAGARSSALRFSLSVIFFGGIAWLEDLQGRPLATEQVQLVQSMARALGSEEQRPEALQFDWPPHNNQQLDLGPEGAAAALTGFLARQLEQRHCRGLVLLGAGHLSHVPESLLQGLTVVRTESTAAMLEQPMCKRQVWTDLQPLVGRS